MRLTCPVVVAVAVAASGALPAASAWAAPGPNPAGVTGLQSGYWWQSQPDGAPLPPPPQVPQNGLWVASDPSGTQAESAIRFTLGDGMTAPVLTLSVSDAQPAQTLSVVACPAASTSAQWKPPGTAGAWSSRPTADCANGSVAGQLSPDAKTMRFDLSKLSTIDTPLVNVVIVPAAIPDPAASALPGTPATTSPSFDLTFNQVETSDVAATAGAVTTPSDMSPSPLPPPVLDQPSANYASSYPSSFDATPPAVSSAPLQPPPASAAASAPPVPPPVELIVPTGAHSSSSSTKPTTRQRWILLSLLVDLALFAAWEERRRQSGAGHARLSLYEIPTMTRDAARQLERAGSPPPLR